MPTPTFYNLNSDKRDRIIKAIKKEFKRTQLIDMSIKRIVEECGIARGSFYQYFTTREDVIEYIIADEYDKEKERIKKFLIKNRGDVFNTSYDYLVSTLDVSAKEIEYFIHIAEYLKDFEIEKFKELDIEEIKKYIIYDNLNINTDEEFRATLNIIILITIFTRITILKNMSKREEFINRYKTELEILKRGLLK